MIPLRRWQTECIESALGSYASGESHFMCLATPGAGKTKMASVLAQRLLDLEMIDLVVCFSPSKIVAHDFAQELSNHTGLRFDGLLGSAGRALTYHAMLSVGEAFWMLFQTHRVFVIFDEIHHCAGDSLTNANAWGEQILTNIQRYAAYTLALSGTPWRSDRLPISLAIYSHINKVQCNYVYGLRDSVCDRVCRKPRIVAINNNHIELIKGDNKQRFESISELFEDSSIPYESLIREPALIKFVLSQAINQLESERAEDCSSGALISGGLIVASNVSHALQIQSILRQSFGLDSVLVTSHQPDAASQIQAFRSSNDPWIISVGMISEGTNIPRLKVCCYLTRVKTELYFRQVLGRVLRSNGMAEDVGYLFMPAEPTLVEYAQNVATDIPDASVIDQVQSAQPLKIDAMSESESVDEFENDLSLKRGIDLDKTFSLEFGTAETSRNNKIRDQMSSNLEDRYEASIDLYGQFHSQVLTLHGLQL
jgi:superfamily II DNA or RNA helicase